MKDNSKENQKKGMDPDVSDDTLGENTEQTPLAEEVEKERQDKKDKKREGKSDN